MALNAPLLTASFELVVGRKPDLTLRFYEILFQRYPQAQPLFFRRSRNEQGKMLAEALSAVLQHLDNAPWLTETLHSMGKKHIEYGVTPEMYGWVGESLLATLAEVAGSDWSPELNTAWADAYGAISGLMLQGAKGVAAK